MRGLILVSKGSLFGDSSALYIWNESGSKSDRGLGKSLGPKLRAAIAVWKESDMSKEDTAWFNSTQLIGGLANWIACSKTRRLKTYTWTTKSGEVWCHPAEVAMGDRQAQKGGRHQQGRLRFPQFGWGGSGVWSARNIHETPATPEVLQSREVPTLVSPEGKLTKKP